MRDVAAAARWIAGDAARRRAGRAVDLVIVEAGRRATVIGEVGLVVVDPRRGWAEVGYWLAAPWRGRGRATAAVDRFSAWALRDLPLSCLFAQVEPANASGSGVVAAAGYGLVGTAADGRAVWRRDDAG